MERRLRQRRNCLNFFSWHQTKMSFQDLPNDQGQPAEFQLSELRITIFETAKELKREMFLLLK